MKWLIILLAILLIVVQIQFWFGKDGVSETISLKHAISAQTKENKQLEKKNKKLAKRVLLLKNGKDMVENLAREQMGMVKPGERYYQFVQSNNLNMADNKDQKK